MENTTNNATPQVPPTMNPQGQQNAPYAVATLVLGILSLTTGCLGAGLICGIIGAVLGSKGFAAYNVNPSLYKGKGMLQAGKIMSIIGIVFGALSLIWLIIAAAAGLAYFEWITNLMGL